MRPGPKKPAIAGSTFIIDIPFPSLPPLTQSYFFIILVFEYVLFLLISILALEYYIYKRSLEYILYT